MRAWWRPIMPSPTTAPRRGEDVATFHRLSRMAQPQAPGLVLHPEAHVGRKVTFGANVVVHAAVEIGDNVTIGDGVVLGKQPSLSKRSAASGEAASHLVIGKGATICTQAIVFAGSEIGAGTIIGDQAHIRERVRNGDD